MRCFVGFALFVVAYFGSCKVLGDFAGPVVVHKYHALVAVIVGLITLILCALPSTLYRISRRNEMRRISGYYDNFDH